MKTIYPTMYKTVGFDTPNGFKCYRAIGQDAASKDDVTMVLVDGLNLGPAWFDVNICSPVL